MDTYHFYQEKLSEVDEKIQAQLETFADKSQGKPLERPVMTKKHRVNNPFFDARKYLYTMTGMDLTEVGWVGSQHGSHRDLGDRP